MSERCHPILTIGHSTQPTEEFVALLRRHDVSVLADVRSAPYSRFNPQFNRSSLAHSLKSHGIKYVFLGRELGARSDDPSGYVNGRVQYSRLAQSDRFRSGLDRIIKGSREHRIALMCAERKPLECHRTLLVARALAATGVPVLHIHADGRTETQDQAMDRLIALAGLPPDDLFRRRTEAIELAAARQEARIAYTGEKLAAESDKSGP